MNADPAGMDTLAMNNANITLEPGVEASSAPAAPVPSRRDGARAHADPVTEDQTNIEVK